MKRFEFTLQSVLDAKTAREQAVAGRVLAAELNCRLARERQQVLQERRAAQVATLARDAASGGTGHAERVHFLERLGGAVTAQARRVANLEEKLDALRQDLHRVTRERKILEKLRERELETWRQDHARLEQHEMDGFAAGGYLRRQFAADGHRGAEATR